MGGYDINGLLDRLGAMGDPHFAAFSAGLIPGIEGTSLGVRTPALRAEAKAIARSGDWRDFLEVSGGHPVYEIRMLHAMVLGAAKCPAEERAARIDAFLPHVDNWAICDGLCSSLKPKEADMQPLFDFAVQCAASDIEFRKRFGLVLLMARFNQPPWLSGTMAAYRAFRHEGYYARMGAAWGLATLWLSDREGCLAILRENLWDPFTHNRAIMKLCESYRISYDDKALARSLRRGKTV